MLIYLLINKLNYRYGKYSNIFQIKVDAASIEDDLEYPWIFLKDPRHLVILQLPAHGLFLYWLIIVYGVFIIVYWVQNKTFLLTIKTQLCWIDNILSVMLEAVHTGLRHKIAKNWSPPPLSSKCPH